MSKVNHLHGAPAKYGALDVTREARPFGKARDMPILAPGEGVVLRDDRYPEMRIAMWLVAGKGRGRSSVRVDNKGNVALSVDIIPVRLGTPGVKPSELNAQELDISGFLIDQLSKGRVRVDHLKDAKGDALGFPSATAAKTREGFQEYTWGVLDEDRLRQLAAELAESEDGRSLLEDWSPKVPSRIERRLLDHRHKTQDGMKADRAVLKKAEAELEKAAGKVRAALAPPKKTTRRSRTAST